MAYSLRPESLDAAMRHFQSVGDSDIFPTPFEFRVLEDQWSEVREELSAIDLDQWAVRRKRWAFAPKGKYAYRIATQLDPLDSLIFEALAIEMGPEVEAQRVPSQYAHSYRFEPDRNAGALYQRGFTWASFLERCLALCEDGVTHVVITDIADFYTRLYHHPLENSLTSIGSDAGRVIFKLIHQWGDGSSYGIPIGPDASRMLAELAITDVDQHLIGEGISYCRYVDDFRLFARSEREAYEHLNSLANVLYVNHGLTLQPAKTRIVPVQDFTAKMLDNEESTELRRLREEFGVLNVGPYDSIPFENLSDDLQAIVRGWNLQALLTEQLAVGTVDVDLARFALARLSQLGDPGFAEAALEHADMLYAVFANVVRYLDSFQALRPDDARQLGSKIVALFAADALVTHLPYHRLWLLKLFAETADWGQAGDLQGLLNKYPDHITRRELILAMGRAGQVAWFRANRGHALDMDPWARRAFLAGSACRPKDERKHWYGSINVHLDPLEKRVVRWVNAGGFERAGRTITSPDPDDLPF